jgi:hypothetical protein
VSGPALAIRDAWLAAGLVVATLATYLGLGLSHEPAAAFRHWDVIFQSDSPRVLGDLTDRDGDHYRTKVHPLFVLLLNPAGRFLAWVFQSPERGAIVLGGLAGATCVGVFFLLLRSLGVVAERAAPYSAAVALSSSHLVFSLWPDTFIFAALTLAVVILTASRATNRWLRIGSAVLAMGMTVTQLVPALLVEATRERGIRLIAKARALCWHLLLVIALAAAGSYVQKLVYPGTQLFFLPTAVQEERSYVVSTRKTDVVLRRLGQVANAGFLFNVVAPRPALIPVKSVPFLGVSFRPLTVSDYRGFGKATAILWVVLLLSAAVAMPKAVRGQALMVGLLAIIGFNLLLHSYYGDEPFLYSCHWTFVLIAIVALALESLISTGRRWWRYVYTALPIVFVVFLAWNNLQFVISLLRRFRDG